MRCFLASCLLMRRPLSWLWIISRTCLNKTLQIREPLGESLRLPGQRRDDQHLV